VRGSFHQKVVVNDVGHQFSYVAYQMGSGELYSKTSSAPRRADIE